MNVCQISDSKKHLVCDVSPTEIVSNIIKLAYVKLKLATSKTEVFVLNKIIVSCKKLLLNLKNDYYWPTSEKIKQYIKANYDLLKVKVGITIRKFIMWTVSMLQKSYEQQRIREKAEAAAKAAAEAAKEAVTKAAESKKDSSELATLYNDGIAVIKTLKQMQRVLIARRYADDRRRISTTKTPTMWEIKYVLGIKPGVSFYEKDWKAYKENGFIVVENKRTGQRYQKPQSEIVAAANAEREEKLNTADPYLSSGGVQYGDIVEITPQQKNSLRNIIKKIGAVIASITGVVTAIKALKSNASGWSRALRDFVANSLSWLHTARETWREVNRAV